MGIDKFCSLRWALRADALPPEPGVNGPFEAHANGKLLDLMRRVATIVGIEIDLHGSVEGEDAWNCCDDD